MSAPPPAPAGESPAISAGEFDRRVMSAIKSAEARGDTPLLRAVEAGRCCFSGELGLGLGFPSAELAAVLVRNLCFECNTADMWKVVEQVLVNRLVYAPHLLALMSQRVIPNRKAQPEAYRLYLELMRSYSLSLPLLPSGPSRSKIVKSMDEALELSSKYGIEKPDFGLVIVLFVLNTITALIDSTLEDFGLPFVKDRNVNEISQPMDIDGKNDKRNELRRNNSLLALEIIENMSSNKKFQVCLRLIHLNMPEQFDGLLNRLRFIESHKLSSKSLVSSNQILEKIFLNVQNAMNGQNKDGSKRRDILGILIGTGSVHSPLSFSNGAGKSGSWISIDIFLENAMDGKTLCPIASFEILTELTRTLQVINQASWQETFQALWISALRLVQRDREPIEGPMPKTDSRLCMLLAIIPLSIAKLVKEEKDEIEASRRKGLVSSLQSLTQFSTLLIPPNPVINACNNAATKAANFVKNGGNNNNLGMMNRNDPNTKSVGSLLHLVVDGCIARELIDTSAYFWPGYINIINPSVSNNKDNNNSMLIQDNPWSNFMQGAPLTGSLQSALISTPATSVAELEKLNHLALNGTEEERAAASKILCGASLTRGWNIQEHVVRIVVKLLSPPLPSDSPVNGPPNHYLTHMHMLNAILSSLSYGDAIHILSLYGVIPEVAAALMPLCEAFGSFPPPTNYKSSTGEEASVYSVFSFAFLFLLRLYKFYAPTQEHCVSGRGGPVRQELTLDYLLLMHNSRLGTGTGSTGSTGTGLFHDLPRHSVYIDSFPKLRAWYCQNQACVASVLSGLSNPSPVHQTANKILSMICRKMNKSGTGTGTGTGTSSGTGTGATGTTTVSASVSVSVSSNNSTSSSVSGSSGSEEGFQRILLPAWEVLEAVPFVLEAVLSACAYGRLSSRDLITGLRDLVDFFPGSLATMVSYFSAEITRGIWKSVAMNGTDWPSPAAALHSVEAEVKAVLARAGVRINNCYPRGMPPMLPLPMAALVSLTITFKLDKSSEYTCAVVGQALENCAVGCGWPSMPIIGALWTQKARKWHDFIILSCTRSPFSRDKLTIDQITKSCFNAFLGADGSSSTNQDAPRGVVGLLGESLASNRELRPGFLYLRTCRTFLDMHYLSGVVFRMVIGEARRLGTEAVRGDNRGDVRLKSGGVSLAAAACAVRQVAMLGASLVCIAGRALLVQVLFEETVPTILLSAREEEGENSGISKSGNWNPVCCVLEGYAMSYLMFLCSALIWGIGSQSAQYKFGSSERRARLVERHMEFINEVLEGNVVLGCEPATWQAHVSCFVGLVVRFAPGWIRSVKTEVLGKLARGLRGWHECQLALELLELGGPGAIESVVESLFSF